MTDCVLTRPDPQELFDRTLARFSSTVLAGGTVIPDSNEWWAVTNDVMAQELWWSVAQQQLRELDPRTACCDNLVKMAALDGVYPRPAISAQGYAKISGVPGSALSQSLVALFGDATYRVDAGASVPPSIPDSGFVFVRMSAEVPGAEASTGGPTGSTGTLTNPPAGVDPNIEIMGGRTCGGQNAETCEEFRSRYLARLSHRHRLQFGDIVDDIMGWPCVTRVCRRECSCCAQRGRLDLYVFMDGTFAHGIPTQNIVDEITAWYFGTPAGFGLGIADFGVEGSFYAARAVPVNVRVSNLPCSTPAQLADIQNRIAAMFSGLCPGAQICRRMIDAIVIGALGFVCDFDVVLAPVGSNTPFCEDFVPQCDELPVAGTISVTGGSIRL